MGDIIHLYPAATRLSGVRPILVETVFTWPGGGFLLSKAIINREVPVLQGTILVLSLVFVATNLVVDLLQSLIDPRIRRT